jgi:hypothetical protein
MIDTAPIVVTTTTIVEATIVVPATITATTVAAATTTTMAFLADLFVIVEANSENDVTDGHAEHGDDEHQLPVQP